MNCQLAWVTIEEVEWLWGQFVLEADAAAEQMQYESAGNYACFAGETLDALAWALEDGGGYWWCHVCECRHILPF
jgi:hypothetical protein